VFALKSLPLNMLLAGFLIRPENSETEMETNYEIRETQTETSLVKCAWKWNESVYLYI